MHLRVGTTRSQILPNVVDLALRALLQEDGGALTIEKLKKVQEQLKDEEQGSNEDQIDEIGLCDIVASGDEIIKVILDGAIERLRLPLDEKEQLKLFGGER